MDFSRALHTPFMLSFSLFLQLSACDDTAGTRSPTNAGNVNNVNNLNAGNVNNVNNNVNNQDPLLAAILTPAPAAEVQEGRTLSLTSAISGGQAPYTVRWDVDGLELSTLEQPGDTIIPEYGDRTLTLTVTDAAGDVAADAIPLRVVDLNEGLKPYFGHLHSHSGLSDGEGTPEEVLTWARDVVGVDFYGMADHSEMLTAGEWDLMRTTTDAFTQPGVFVALRGFEWSHPYNGHMCIFLTDDKTSAISDIWISYIYDWLIANNAIAEFNHPGRELGVFDDLALEPAVASNMFAIETGNKGDGNALGEFLPYYIQALDNGWHVAPMSNQDNHTLEMNSHRSVFWATELTRESLVQAMRDRRFYSSDDPDVEVMFRSEATVLGGTVTMAAPGQVEFQIKVVDNEPIRKLELITGGGQVAAVLEPVPGTTRLTWFHTVDVSADAWFFLKVTCEDTLDGEGPIQIAVTAPIYFMF